MHSPTTNTSLSVSQLSHRFPYAPEHPRTHITDRVSPIVCTHYYCEFCVSQSAARQSCSDQFLTIHTRNQSSSSCFPANILCCHITNQSEKKTPAYLTTTCVSKVQSAVRKSKPKRIIRYIPQHNTTQQNNTHSKPTHVSRTQTSSPSCIRDRGRSCDSANTNDAIVVIIIIESSSLLLCARLSLSPSIVHVQHTLAATVHTSFCCCPVLLFHKQRTRARACIPRSPRTTNVHARSRNRRPANLEKKPHNSPQTVPT